MAGCKKEKVEEQTKPVIQEPPPPPPPPPPAEEVKTPPQPETLVSKEDIEKAAKIYKLLHDESLKKEAIKEKFAKMLEEYEWDLEKYEHIVFDIGRDPASAKIYKELQEKE